MQKIYPVITALLAVVIVIGFFLPWISVESPQMGAVTKILTGKQQFVDKISAFRIPILANSNEGKLVISIIQIFNPGIENADKKSFLIWGIIVLAGAIVALSFFLGKNPWVNLAIGILGVAIFAVAFFKISTTSLDKIVLQVKIREGLWMTLYAYLLIGGLSLVRFIQQIKQKT